MHTASTFASQAELEFASFFVLKAIFFSTGY
jgi:hypothetical protein